VTIGKMTLLDLVQTILEKMDSDEVNSINDTVESHGVALEVRDSFRHITANSEDYQKEGYAQLESLSNKDFPNQLRIPDNIVRIEDLWYKNGYGQRVCPEYMDPRTFVERQFRVFGECPTEAAAYGTTGPCFPYGADADAEYYTTFDEQTVFFDRVDLRDQETIQGRSSGIRGVIAPEFKLEDTFVPPLMVDEFPLLLNEAIDACFVHFKGVSNSKAQLRARQQKVMKQNNRDRIRTTRPPQLGPPYGRFARG